MPNHVTNILQVSGDDAQRQAMFEAIQFEELGPGSFDFGKVIPMPESLNVECSNRNRQALELYKQFLAESASLALGDLASTDVFSGNAMVQDERIRTLAEKYEEMSKDDPGLLPLGQQCYQNIQAHGYDTWYDWSIANWGTKWNSYGYPEGAEQSFDGATLTFDTAWSNPEPVIAALAAQYPSLGFTHKWADEDFGNNVGLREFAGGKEISCHLLPDGSSEALELAAEVQGMSLEEMSFSLNETTGEYEYKEPEVDFSMELQ